MAWTDERIDTLKTLWGQGMTASQIADELGGVSRNAVIGKAHRLGLESRPSPVRPNEAPATATTPPSPVEPACSWCWRRCRNRRRKNQRRTSPRTGRAPQQPVSQPTIELSPGPVMRSIGPGGFQRQAPGEQGAPIPPAPPRRLVPAKPSADIADKTSLLELNDKICKWPLGHPGEPDFHFCGKPVNVGLPLLRAALLGRLSGAAAAPRSPSAAAAFRRPAALS